MSMPIFPKGSVQGSSYQNLTEQPKSECLKRYILNNVQRQNKDFGAYV